MVYTVWWIIMHYISCSVITHEWNILSFKDLTHLYKAHLAYIKYSEKSCDKNVHSEDKMKEIRTLLTVSQYII